MQDVFSLSITMFCLVYFYPNVSFSLPSPQTIFSTPFMTSEHKIHGFSPYLNISLCYKTMVKLNLNFYIFFHSAHQCYGSNFNQMFSVRFRIANLSEHALVFFGFELLI